MATAPNLTPAISSRDSELTELQRMGKLLAASGYFADAREMAQAAVKVLAGRELGIPAIASMMGVSIIKGKIVLSGNLIASRIRAHGYDYRHKQFDNAGCVLVFMGKPDADGNRALLGESSFNEADARQAGCFGDMYRKYPRNMYFNRALSNGAKWFTPEVFAGAPVYVAEELGARVDESGDMIQHDTEHDKHQADGLPAVLPSEPRAQIVEMRPPQLAASLAESIPDEWGEVPLPPDERSEIEMQLAASVAILDAFAGLQKRYQRLGTEKPYFGMLSLHGQRTASGFSDVQKARLCYKEMKGDIERREERAR